VEDVFPVGFGGGGVFLCHTHLPIVMVEFLGVLPLPTLGHSVLAVSLVFLRTRSTIRLDFYFLAPFSVFFPTRDH